MNKYIQIFIDFLQTDKEYVEKFLDTLTPSIIAIGEYLERHLTIFHSTYDKKIFELLDLMDGNGFEIVYHGHGPIDIIPIYQKEKEKEKEKEEIKTIEQSLQELSDAIKNLSCEYTTTSSTTYTVTSSDNYVATSNDLWIKPDAILPELKPIGNYIPTIKIEPDKISSGPSPPEWRTLCLNKPYKLEEN